MIGIVSGDYARGAAIFTGLLEIAGDGAHTVVANVMVNGQSLIQGSDFTTTGRTITRDGTLDEVVALLSVAATGEHTAAVVLCTRWGGIERRLTWVFEDGAPQPLAAADAQGATTDPTQAPQLGVFYDDAPPINLVN